MLGALLLRWDAGREALNFVAEQVTYFLGYTNKGSEFVYGVYFRLLHTAVRHAGHLTKQSQFCVRDPAMQANHAPMAIFGPTFAFSVLSTVIFFSSFIAMLYHLGILQFVIKRLAIILQV